MVCGRGRGGAGPSIDGSAPRRVSAAHGGASVRCSCPLHGAGLLNATVKTFNVGETITQSHIHVGSTTGQSNGVVACTISSPLVANLTNVACTIGAQSGCTAAALACRWG